MADPAALGASAAEVQKLVEQMDNAVMEFQRGIDEQLQTAEAEVVKLADQYQASLSALEAANQAFGLADGELKTATATCRNLGSAAIASSFQKSSAIMTRVLDLAGAAGVALFSACPRCSYCCRNIDKICGFCRQPLQP